MKTNIALYSILATTILFTSCSDDLDKFNNTFTSQSIDSKEGNVILQKRNPNLAKIKKYKSDDLQTKGDISGETGNSDAFLGSGYKSLKGNYILGDSKNTLVLVAGESSGSKYAKAESLGVFFHPVAGEFDEPLRRGP